MDLSRRIHTAKICAERQIAEAGTFLAIWWRPKVLYGLQNGPIHQFLDNSHFAEELQYIAGREGNIQGSYRQSGTSRKYV